MTPRQAAVYGDWLVDAATHFSSSEQYPFISGDQMFNPEWLLQP